MIKGRKRPDNHIDDIEKQKLIADIKKKAETFRKLINDKRYTEYKELLESAIKYKQVLLESLPDSVQTNDEFVRKSLVLSTEIKTIKWLLNTPNKFILKDSDMTKKEETHNVPE